MPRYSFDRQVDEDLQAWAEIAEQGLCLVHTFNLSAFKKGDLSKAPAQEVFTRWDVISTSLIVRRRLVSGRVRRNERIKYAYHCGPTPMYENVGLILRVPPQNILGTFSEDVFFYTDAPADEFADRIFGLLPSTLSYAGPYNLIKSPTEVMERTCCVRGQSRYNEILVVGRPNARVHLPLTRTVEVQGIIYLPSNNPVARMNDELLIRRLQELNDLDVEEA